MGDYPFWLQPALPDLSGPIRRHDLEGLYVEAKNRWIAAHPEATPAEYEAEILAITERLGI